MKNNIKQMIKKYLIKENKTFVDVINLINNNRSDDNKISKQNLNNKLTRGTIKYSEVLEIADVLGYTILWEKKAAGYNQIKNKSDIDYYDTVEKAYESTFPNRYVRSNRTRLNKDSTSENENVQLTQYSYPSNKVIEIGISRFLTIVFNIISEVNLPEVEIKKQFEYLKNNKSTLSNENIFSDYFSILYTILLMTSVGNEFIPTLYFLRNTYINGGLINLPPDSKSQLSRLLMFFNRKYRCYIYQDKDI